VARSDINSFIKFEYLLGNCHYQNADGQSSFLKQGSKFMMHHDASTETSSYKVASPKQKQAVADT